MQLSDSFNHSNSIRGSYEVKLPNLYKFLKKHKVYSHVIPSALKSCILVQADTILMDNLSTMSTRHSTPGAVLPAACFFGGPLYLTTSFIISRMKMRISFQRLQKLNHKFMTNYGIGKSFGHERYFVTKKKDRGGSILMSGGKGGIKKKDRKMLCMHPSCEWARKSYFNIRRILVKLSLCHLCLSGVKCHCKNLQNKQFFHLFREVFRTFIIIFYNSSFNKQKRKKKMT